MALMQFDYGIIGAGAAGLQLALALSNDEYFKKKRILILDKAAKNKNDKTWCFWEEGKGQWDDIVSNKWEKCLFADKKGVIKLALKPLCYKKIRSLDFYTYAKAHLNKKNNFTFVIDEVKNLITDENGVSIIANKNEYNVKHCFDSRVDNAFYSNNPHPNLQQHFIGWVIDFKKPVLDETAFTIMDYRASHNGSTSFMYVLPLDKQKALVEFTGFTKTVFDKKVYATAIANYIKQHISDNAYAIIEKEGGIIPMSTYPFEKINTKWLTKIGTAGGWVRPSSGYSFKNCERYVAKIIKNLKRGKMPSKDFVNKKHRLFDAVLLEILATDNSYGLTIFSNLYRKNKLPKLLKFIDGTSSFTEDLRIMKSVNKLKFTRAMLRVKNRKLV